MYSMSAPGRILILILRYPSASDPRALSTSARGLSWMPMEMPVAIVRRVPSSSRERLVPSRSAHSAQAPISTAAFAIGWPRMPRRSMSSITFGWLMLTPSVPRGNPLGQRQPGRVDGLGGEVRPLAGDALAPGGRAVGVFELQQQDSPARRAAGRDLERLAQRHPDLPQRDARQAEAHRSSPGGRSGGFAGGCRRPGDQVVRVVGRLLVLEAGHAVAVGQVPGERSALDLLPRPGARRIGCLERVDVGRCGHANAGGRRQRSFPRGPCGVYDRYGSGIGRRRCGSDRPLFVESPFHDEAVRVQSGVQRAARVAVHVDDVLHGRRPEAVQVEVGVARHERIVRPQHAADVSFQELVALKLLEPLAEAGPARLGPHREHVRPVHELAVADAADPEDEAEQPAVSVERARRHPADPLGDHQNGGRHDVPRSARPTPRAGAARRHRSRRGTRTGG